MAESSAQSRTFVKKANARADPPCSTRLGQHLRTAIQRGGDPKNAVLPSRFTGEVRHQRLGRRIMAAQYKERWPPRRLTHATYAETTQMAA